MFQLNGFLPKKGIQKSIKEAGQADSDEHHPLFKPY